MFQTIDENLWIKSILDIDDPSVISSVIYFSLFWNFFENKYFETNFKSDKIYPVYQKIKNYDFIDQYTNELIEYFILRYVCNGRFTKKYDTLFIRNIHDKQLVENVLLLRDINQENKFKELIIIISRFRNNYFHGIKCKNEILNQNNIFALLNTYLSVLNDLHN